MSSSKLKSPSAPSGAGGPERRMSGMMQALMRVAEDNPVIQTPTSPNFVSPLATNNKKNNPGGAGAGGGGGKPPVDVSSGQRQRRPSAFATHNTKPSLQEVAQSPSNSAAAAERQESVTKQPYLPPGAGASTKDQESQARKAQHNSKYHYFVPHVERVRPSTASRSKLVGEYKALHQLRDSKEAATLDATTRAMEVLCCVQQLDYELCGRQNRATWTDAELATAPKALVYHKTTGPGAGAGAGHSSCVSRPTSAKSTARTNASSVGVQSSMGNCSTTTTAATTNSTMRLNQFFRYVKGHVDYGDFGKVQSSPRRREEALERRKQMHQHQHHEAHHPHDDGEGGGGGGGGAITTDEDQDSNEHNAPADQKQAGRRQSVTNNFVDDGGHSSPDEAAAGGTEGDCSNNKPSKRKLKLALPPEEIIRRLQNGGTTGYTSSDNDENGDNDDDDMDGEQRFHRWRRREAREVLTRRTEKQEAALVHKLQALIRGEQRRETARYIRVTRPLLEKANAQAMLWMKYIQMVRPMMSFVENLRQARAKKVLNGVFVLQVARYLSRRRKRIEKQEWEAMRRKNMARPTVSTMFKAVPLLKQLPHESVEQLIGELIPKCFKLNEYVSYSSTKLSACLLRSMSSTQRKDSSSNMLTLLGDSSPASSSGDLLGVVPPVGTGNIDSTLANGAPNRDADQFLYIIERGMVTVHSTLAGGDGGGGGGSGKAGKRQSSSSPLRGGGATASSSSSAGSEKRMSETVSSGGAVGVEALLGTDVKKVVAIASTDVDTWCISIDHLRAYISQCSTRVQTLFTQIAEDRRKDMMKLQPLVEENVRSASLVFQQWSSQGIQSLISQLKPVIIRRGTEIKVKGVYFLVHGRVDIIRKKGGDRRGGGMDGMGSMMMTSIGGGSGSGLKGSVGGGVASSFHGSLGGTVASSNAIPGSPGLSIHGGGRNQNANVEVIRAGQSFGEAMCFMEVTKLNKIVRAMASCDVWFIKRADFLELAVHEHVIALLPVVSGIGIGMGAVPPKAQIPGGGK